MPWAPAHKSPPSGVMELTPPFNNIYQTVSRVSIYPSYFPCTRVLSPSWIQATKSIPAQHLLTRSPSSIQPDYLNALNPSLARSPSSTRGPASTKASSPTPVPVPIHQSLVHSLSLTPTVTLLSLTGQSLCSRSVSSLSPTPRQLVQSLISGPGTIANPNQEVSPSPTKSQPGTQATSLRQVPIRAQQSVVSALLTTTSLLFTVQPVLSCSHSTSPLPIMVQPHVPCSSLSSFPVQSPLSTGATSLKLMPTQVHQSPVHSPSLTSPSSSNPSKRVPPQLLNPLLMSISPNKSVLLTGQASLTRVASPVHQSLLHYTSSPNSDQQVTPHLPCPSMSQCPVQSSLSTGTTSLTSVPAPVHQSMVGSSSSPIHSPTTYPMIGEPVPPHVLRPSLSPCPVQTSLSTGATTLTSVLAPVHQSMVRSSSPVLTHVPYLNSALSTGATAQTTVPAAVYGSPVHSPSITSALLINTIEEVSLHLSSPLLIPSLIPSPIRRPLSAESTPLMQAVALARTPSITPASPRNQIQSMPLQSPNSSPPATPSSPAPPSSQIQSSSSFRHPRPQPSQLLHVQQQQQLLSFPTLALNQYLPAVHTVTSIQPAQLQTPPIGEVCLGRGAYGQVYLKYLNNRPVAVKYCATSGTEALEREARSMSLLSSHRSFPTLHGLMVDGGQTAVVMDFIGNATMGLCMTLSRALRSQRPLTLSSTAWLRIALNLVYGLEYMHSKCLLHNDIKTDNLLMQYDAGVWHAFIIDVGLCTLTSHPRTRYLTEAQRDRYRQVHVHIAPELVEDGEPESKMSDIFQLGRVLYSIGQLGGVPDLMHLGSWCTTRNPRHRPSIGVLRQFIENRI